ncbi:PQQ-dependent sugar dehydrogenase [Natronoglomus mannanivorans]|uniref:PQQ-dependent sugar dehydrogenase n=1 Tax=Natronoglomus mannanivorans TaxID=2979990 RepID=A0AAP3E4Z9_9EURY|nr:PQQ-dependent sugar dehydrogenase [Halobacteria archaeon AArc-xg1-1]
MTRQLEEPNSRPPFPTRRRVLRAVAATGMVAGLGPAVLAQDVEQFEFGGEAGGWQGRSPAAIDGETNPPLDLEAGQTYEVSWENLDGLPHDFTILDADGAELVGTETVDEEGATETLEFEATGEMAEYYCSVHTEAMRGEIQIGDPTEEDVADEPSVIAEGPTIGLERVAEGFVAPVGFEVAPGEEEADEDRYYVLDQVGRIYVVDENGRADEPFLDLTDRMVEVGDGDGDFDERGVLGLAFHPDYQENHRLFVYYSGQRRDGTPEDYDHTGVLAEFEADEDGERVDPDSERTILEIPQPQFNHNGGPVLFGPDGYLYLALGDGGDGDDTGMGHVEDWYDGNEGGNGQNTTENFLGGILRLDVDSEPDEDHAYAIPDDNPFAEDGELEGEGLEEYYAWGLRNPWRASFDGEGQFFVGDVGQLLFEEGGGAEAFTRKW